MLRQRRYSARGRASSPPSHVHSRPLRPHRLFSAPIPRLRRSRWLFKFNTKLCRFLLFNRMLHKKKLTSIQESRFVFVGFNRYHTPISWNARGRCVPEFDPIRLMDAHNVTFQCFYSIILGCIRVLGPWQSMFHSLHSDARADGPSFNEANHSLLHYRSRVFSFQGATCQLLFPGQFAPRSALFLHSSLSFHP
jgi:hypothetical protein